MRPEGVSRGDPILFTASLEKWSPFGEYFFFERLGTMKIGIIGLQNSGKTTIFNALTRSEAEVADYSNAKAEPNLAVVNVEDERIDRLVEIYQPRKTVRATVEFIDFAGVSGKSGDKGGFPPELVQAARTTDALVVVLRNFPSDLMGEPDHRVGQRRQQGLRAAARKARVSRHAGGHGVPGL